MTYSGQMTSTSAWPIRAAMTSAVAMIGLHGSAAAARNLDDILLIESEWQASAQPLKPALTHASIYESEKTTVTSAVTQSYIALGYHDRALDPVVRLPAWQISYDQLAEIETFSDGWGGYNSKAALSDSVIDSKLLLSRLEAALPTGPSPKIGVDDEGYIVFTWDERHVVGSLSVFEDGTYEFYLKGKTGKLGSASREISEGDFKDGFVNILSV